jgi:amino acid adenylation domain-containing protein
MTTFSPTIPRRPSDAPGCLSFPQERLFLLDRIMPGLAAYNVPTLVRVPAHLDADVLRRACELVVQRHEILRTRIRLLDGEPVGVVADDPAVALTVADLRAAPASERHARATELLAELARRPFDLGADNLLRIGLVHVGAEEDLLLVVLHHIGSDHASSGLLFSELDAAYQALRADREPELPVLPIQYADFAHWQRRHLSGPALDELLEYWRGQLNGAPERLDLPTDRPRPGVQSYRGALREFTIDPGAAQSVRDLARSQGVSTFMVLLAAFKALIHRYTGVEDLVVGAPVSGRHYEEISQLLGFFSNTLALRTDLSGDPTFAELLARVKATTLEAQIFQELPFEKLVEALNPERAQSHSPLFQVLLGYDVAPEQAPRLDGAELEQLPVPGWAWARFDLSIVVREVPDGSLRAQLEYATDLFDETTIDRLVGHYRTLLADAAGDVTRRLSELTILTEPERERLLVAFNDTGRDYDRRCLHELISEQAAHTPDAVAVVSGEQLISYAELERRSNQLARELAALDVATGTLVGICMERSVDLVVAMLAVLKSGAAYVPIDPSYPPQRQEFMLADAAAPVLLTQERLLGTVDPRGARVLCLDRDRDRERIAGREDVPLPSRGDPEQLAYVIYTSGSTGQPKGVEVTHRSVANLVAHMRERPGLGAGDVVANLTTPAFDLSVPDWYLTLASGARLALIPREATLDGVELADWLARTGATFVQATPTTWQLLVDAGWKGSAALKIVCGGEALPRALADDLLARGAALWHMYGPTETTVWSSVLSLEAEKGAVKLGGPIANTTFYVLDGHGAPVPAGVAGELYIGGDGLAAGYRGRLELTAQKFVPDRFAPVPGQRLYRTGDLMRWRDSGTLEYLGRIDQQVKLRGFRIELGEIETVLATHPQVNGAVALVREDTPGDRRLVAYVVPAAGERPDIDALRRLLKTKLPPFMVPSAFVALDAFPVTANGKLDQRSLPAPDGARPDLGRSFTAPETHVQESLAAIWREVLGLERVGIDDDFFDLGGHSLLAVKMLARVQDAFGVDLYLGRVFEESTIRGLAAVIAAQLIGDVDDDEVASLLDELEGMER